MPKPVLNILLFCLLFSIEGFSSIFGVNSTEKSYLQAITQASAGKDTSICVPGLQLYANTPGTNETGTWQVLTGTGILSNTAIPNSTFSSTTNGVNVLSWSILNTITSELSIDTIIITINPPPTIANAGLSVITCSSSLKLGGNTPVIGSGKWSLLSGSGNFINNTLGNTSVTGLSPGFNIYQWTITNATCKSVSTVSINFNFANAGANQEVCTDVVTLTGSIPSVSNGQWTQTFPAIIGDGSDPIIGNDINSVTGVSQLAPGKNVFRWTTRNFSPNSCVSPSALVTITNDTVSTANAGQDQVLCANLTTLTASAITLGNGTWNILTGTGVSISNSTSNVTTVTNLPKGNTIVQWSVTKGICYSRDTVIVTNNSPSQATILSQKKPFICSDTTTLVAMAPVQGTGIWTRILGTAAITAPNSLTTSLTGIPFGVSQYLWVVSFPGCTPSYDTVTVTRQNPETAQVQTHYLQMCNSNIASIVGLNTTPGIGSWHTISGTGTIASPGNAQTTISYGTDGRTQLQWQINIAGCAPSVDTLTIDHSSVSIATVSGSRNQTICTDSILLTAVNPSIGKGIWTFFSGTGTFLNSTLPGTFVKNLAPNRNTLRWTVSSSFCSSFITVTITNNKPSNALANADKSICSANDTLIAVAATQGIGVWSVLTSTGIIGSGPTNQKFISNLNLGKNSFLWTITKGTCKSYDTLNLTNKSPSPANILTVNDTLLCRNLIYLRSRTPIQGTGSWFNISGTGIICASSINGTVTGTSITGLSYGANIFLWSVSVPGCAASMQTVTVNNHKVTVPAGSAIDSCLSVNVSNPATIYLNANASSNPGESATWRTIISPSGFISYFPNNNLPSTTVSGTGGSGYYKFGWKISDASGQCVNEDTVAVTVLPQALPASNQCLKSINAAILLNTTLTSTTILKTGQGEFGRWNLLPTGFDAVVLNSITGVASAIDKGVHTFQYITQNSNMPACKNIANTIVTVLSKADIVPKNICLSNINYTTANANIANPINFSVGGKGVWSTITGGDFNSLGGNSININIPTVAGINKFIFTTSNINDLSCIDIDTLKVTNLSVPKPDTIIYILTTTTSAQIKLNAVNNVVPSAGEIGNWTFTGVPAFVIDSLYNPKSPVHNLLPGINQLFWRIVNTVSGCSLMSTVTAFVQTKAIANAGPPIVFKNPNPAIAYTGTITSPNLLSVSRGEYGKWTLVSTTAYSLPTSTVGSNMNTINLANLRRGVSVFRWTIYNVSFPGSIFGSNYDETAVTVMTKAIADTNKRCITDSANIILGNRPTVPIRPIGGEIFAWTSKPALPANSIIFTETDSIPLVTILGLPMGQTKFYFSITSTGSGAIDVDSVVITKVTNPDPGINITPYPLCDTIFHLQPINVPQTLTGESFQWQKLNGGSHFSNTGYNPYVSPLDTGNNAFKYTITNGTCIKSKTVTLRNNQPYLVTITGSNTSCFASNTLQGNDPTLQFKTATSEWIMVRQPKEIGTDTAVFQTPFQSSTVFNPMLVSGTYTFKYKVKNLSCELTSDTFNIIRGTSISVNPPPSYVTICKSYFVMQAEPVQPNVTGTWTCVLGCNNNNIINRNDPHTIITSLGTSFSGQPYKLVWQVRNEVCNSDIYNVTIVAFSKPSTATIIQSDQLFCERDTISLTTLVPNGGVNGNKLWYASPSGENFSNPLSGNTLVSNLQYGTSHIIYQVSTGDSCPVNRDTITIIRYQRTTNISPGSDSLVCGNLIRLNAETPNVAGALAKWSIISTLTSPISDPTDPKATITTSISGNYKLKWRVVNGACIDSSQITYKVREIPTRASVTLDTLPICDTSTYTLKGNIPAIGKGKWSSIGNSNRIANDTLAITKTYITNYGRNWFAWVISNDFCNSSDTISITNSTPPTRAKAGENTTVCTNEITLTGNNPTHGSPEWVMTDHTLTATSYTNSVVAKNLTAGLNTFIYMIQSPGCAPSMDSIIVTYNMATPAYAGRDTIICRDTLILYANVPIQGTGKWALENGSGKFEDLEDPKTQLTTIGNGSNTYTWTIINGDCPASVSTIKISNNKPSLVSFTQDKPVYKNFTELNGPIPVNGTGKWLKLKGNGIIEEPANPISIVKDLDAGENIFRWSVSNVGCDSIYFDQKINFTDITIPNGFSPNNDSFNDKFKILGIEEYPGSKLEVYNRWGRLVYLNDKYSPDTEWDGTDTKNEVLGNDTYFYVLTLPTQKIYKSSVLLTR